MKVTLICSLVLMALFFIMLWAALEEKLRIRGLHPKIITGHTGWTDDLDFAFAQRDKVCNAYVKQKPHDRSAPYDGYDESDDRSEKARSTKLAMVGYRKERV